MTSDQEYHDAIDPDRVGTYPGLAKSGGGLVRDAVLEYRAWCHPERGAEDPLVLVLYKEYLSEPEPQKYIHVRKERTTDCPVEFLMRPKRTEKTIPDFLSPDAPSNRLDILRGLAPGES